MASLVSIRRQPKDLASLATCATRSAFACQRTAARTLPSVSSRHLTTCLARPNTQATRSSVLRVPQSLTSRFPSRSPQIVSVRCISEKTWNSEESPDKTPSFRDWKFEDINALLPSEAGGSPPSSPQKRLILVDVREPVELLSTGVIPTAVAVPMSSQPDALYLSPEEFETRFGFPKPGVPEASMDPSHGGAPPSDIVFYCKAGVRARTAAQLAVQAGYDESRIGVYNGSWLDWAAKGGRSEKWEGDLYD
ncbi:hypothetical protein BDV18DRAFT_127941 [Aspergillus unguis]